MSNQSKQSSVPEPQPLSDGEMEQVQGGDGGGITGSMPTQSQLQDRGNGGGDTITQTSGYQQYQSDPSQFMWDTLDSDTQAAVVESRQLG